MKRVLRYKNKKRFRIAMLIVSMFILTGVLFACKLHIRDKNSRHHDTIARGEESQNVDPMDRSAISEDKTPEVIEEIKREDFIVPKNIAIGSRPSDFKEYSWEVIEKGTLIDSFNRQPKVSFSDPDKYSLLEGITTFRGNNYRNSASFGYSKVIEEELEPIWFSTTGYIDSWTGVGWNGQPAIVKWDDEVKNIMNISPEKKNKKDLIEIIYATMDGKVYFIDLEDGLPTRSPIDTGYPIKGSVTIDPRGYPLLYTGQGIPDRGGKYGPIGFKIFNLIDQKQIYFIDGMDKDAFRKWGAFDSAPLIDANTDTLVECGENGIIYTAKLNTDFDINKATISINPEIIKFRYTSPIRNKVGTENSPAAYKNLIYFADNGGFFQCLDINTLEPLWVRDVTDDTDSTTVLQEEENDGVSLYTACEVDLQGDGGYSYMRKINALTGELLWENSLKCSFNSNSNGGALATPVVGKNEIENLVIFNIGRTRNKGCGGNLIAFDKETGKKAWDIELDYYCWSSPVDIYTEEGRAYLIVCDSGGFMRLLDGKTGKELHKIPLEANIEASPAVYGNTIVVGTRGQKIWGIKIK